MSWSWAPRLLGRLVFHDARLCFLQTSLIMSLHIRSSEISLALQHFPPRDYLISCNLSEHYMQSPRKAFGTQLPGSSVASNGPIVKARSQGPCRGQAKLAITHIPDLNSFSLKESLDPSVSFAVLSRSWGWCKEIKACIFPERRGHDIGVGRMKC